MRGQYIRNGTLGELNSNLSDERGEIVRPPSNLPPNANQVAPVSPGSNPGGPQMQQVGNDQSNWAVVNFTIGMTAVKIQPALFRKFLVLQNKDPVGTMFFGFGWVPTPANGLELPPGTGYEPFRYPTNDIYVIGSQNGMNGLLIYGM